MVLGAPGGIWVRRRIGCGTHANVHTIHDSNVVFATAILCRLLFVFGYSLINKDEKLPIELWESTHFKTTNIRMDNDYFIWYIFIIFAGCHSTSCVLDILPFIPFSSAIRPMHNVCYRRTIRPAYVCSAFRWKLWSVTHGFYWPEKFVSPHAHLYVNRNRHFATAEMLGDHSFGSNAVFTRDICRTTTILAPKWRAPSSSLCY